MLTAFVESALRDGPVAEETGDDLVGLLQLERQRHAGRKRNAAADDRDAGDHALAHVADMHRSALAPAAAGRGAEQLVEQFLLGQSLGEGVPVATEGRGDEVVRSQRGADPDRRRFLALALVNRAGHRALEEKEAHAFLELADADHPL